MPGTLQYPFGYSKSLKVSEKREFDDDDEDHDEANFFLKYLKNRTAPTNDPIVRDGVRCLSVEHVLRPICSISIF